MAIVSRRWSRGVSAGASCLCGGEPSLSGETGHIEWVCPKCAASAHVCARPEAPEMRPPCPSRRPTTMDDQCHLPRGHQGQHRTPFWGWSDEQAATYDRAALEANKVAQEAYQRGVADEAKDKARLVEESYQRGRREALAEALSRLVERADVLGDQEAEAISKAAKLGEARRELHAAAARIDALVKGEG